MANDSVVIFMGYVPRDSACRREPYTCTFDSKLVRPEVAKEALSECDAQVLAVLPIDGDYTGDDGPLVQYVRQAGKDFVGSVGPAMALVLLNAE